MANKPDIEEQLETSKLLYVSFTTTRALHLVAVRFSLIKIHETALYLVQDTSSLKKISTDSSLRF